MTRGSIRPAALLASLGLFLLAGTPAPGERLPVRSYTIDDGLPSDDVRRIVRDAEGYLWFLTTAGLCRFDGEVFTTFGPEHGLPAGLPRDLLETSEGLFLVGTADGLYWHDPAASDTEPMFNVARPVASGLGNAVNALHEDREGRIWCGTHRGLYSLERSSDGWLFHPASTGRPPGDIQGNAIRDIFEDRFGSLWITTPSGLIWRGRDGSVDFLTDRDGLPHTDLHRLTADSEGRVWLGTASGLALLEPDPVTGRPVVLRTFGAEEGLVEPSGLVNFVRDLVFTSQGELWTASYGLVRIVPDTRSGPDLRTFDTSNGLSSPHIMAVGEDLEGNVWAGTSDSGVMRIARAGFISYGPGDGLRVGRPSAFLEDEPGVLRVVTAGRPRVCTFDGQSFTEVDPLLPDAIEDMGWGAGQIAFPDHLGEWWFATFGGLVRFPRVHSIDDLAVTPPRAHYTTHDGLLSDGVFRLYEDSRGDLWIGMMHYTVPERNGLQRWDRATEAFQTYGEPDGVPRDIPSAFGEDQSGNLWVGFYSRGVGRFRAGRFRLFSEADGAPHGDVSQIHLDRVGRLWIATRCCGVFRIDDPDSEQPDFVSHGKGDGLAADAFHSITEDDWGRLYLGSDLGIDRLDPATGQVAHYSRQDGLIDNWVHIAFRQRDGTLWFGTSQGVSRLVPEPDRPAYSSSVHIRELRIAGVSRELSPFGETDISGLKLAAGQREVELEFSGLSFATGEGLRFQYRLAGANENWSSPTATRKIHFANLSPGRYRLQIRAIDAEGIATPTPATVSFRILPPFWRQWWFLLGVGLLAASAGVLLHRLRLKRALELERVRTRIATDLHDDIGASLSQVSILSEVVRRQVGDTFPSASRSLEQIADTARQLMDSMRDIVWAINPKRDRAADLVQRMRRFASDTFSAKDVEFRFDAPANGHDRRLDIELRRQVFLIFKEAVNNAARHSGCSTAEVRFHMNGRNLELDVRDDGCGFEPGSVGNGHGLPSMRQRARSLGGSFSIESKHHAGTALHLHVPLRG